MLEDMTVGRLTADGNEIIGVNVLLSMLRKPRKEKPWRLCLWDRRTLHSQDTRRCAYSGLRLNVAVGGWRFQE
jgi:hypothetical protein